MNSWSESLEIFIANETAGYAYDLVFLKKSFLQNQEQTILLLK